MSKHVPSLQARVAELMNEVETLKKEKDNFERNFNNVNECYEGIYDNYEKLKSDYALLSEQFKEVDMTATKLATDYAQLQDNYNVLSKHHDDLIYKFNENLDQHRTIEAENYALTQEIERTNRHINLAENVIHEAKEQQPLVVNHYHNCTINK